MSQTTPAAAPDARRPPSTPPRSIGALWNSALTRRALRAALASPFIASGLVKLLDWNGAVAEFEGLGIWSPRAAVAAVIIAQLVGSALLVTNRGALSGAAILAGFTALATLIAHPFWLFHGADRVRQLTTFLEHVALIGGLCAAAILASWPRPLPPFRGRPPSET